MKVLFIIFSSTFTLSVPVNRSEPLGGRDAYLCKEMGTVSGWNVGRFRGERRARLRPEISPRLRGFSWLEGSSDVSKEIEEKLSMAV